MGNITTSYSYSPYGETSQNGLDLGNNIQYSGRENDNTGLYYYRARYYSPELKRFISEDPIGISGGTNAYRYVEDNPINRTDPSGLFSFVIYGNTCGPGNPAPYTPVKGDCLDASCARHDQCYDDAGCSVSPI